MASCIRAERFVCLCDEVSIRHFHAIAIESIDGFRQVVGIKVGVALRSDWYVSSKICSVIERIQHDKAPRILKVASTYSISLTKKELSRFSRGERVSSGITQVRRKLVGFLISSGSWCSWRTIFAPGSTLSHRSGWSSRSHVSLRSP